MKKPALAVIFVLFVQSAYALNGSEWFYAGFSPAANGMAYAGAASLSSAGDVFFNPANPAFTRRLTIFGQWGITATNYVADLGVSTPTLRGVMTLGMRTMYVAPTNSIGSALAFTAAFSKFVNNRLAVGLSAQIVNQSDTTGADFGLTADLGMILRLKNVTSEKTPFGLYDNRLGFVLTGLGKPVLLDSSTPVPAIGLRAGFATKLIQTRAFVWNWEWDAGIYALPFTFYTSLGTKFSIAQRLNISFGAIYGNNGLGGSATGLIAYTAGVSFSFQYEDTPFEIFYSYNPYRYTSDTAAHFVGGEVGFGLLDKTPPSVDFRVDGPVSNAAVFSPNYDGANDSVTFDMSVRDASLITNWYVTIVDKDGITVKSYRGAEERDVRLTVQGFFKNLFAKKQGLVIPSKIVWNGISDSGHIAGDGLYRAVMTAYDEYGNAGVSATNLVTVDLSAPSIQLGIDNLVFSPNGDGRKDTVTIYHTVTPGDDYKAEIRDRSGDLIRSWRWFGNIPATLVWDGTDMRGEPAPEGAYDYVLLGSDKAGNKSVMTIPNICLSRQAQSVFLNLDRTAISPNGDGNADSLTVTPNLSDASGLASWTLSVVNASSNTVMQWAGTNNAPVPVKWAGLDSAGKRLPDGEYGIKLHVEYASGNSPDSPDYTVRVDTSVPNIEVGFLPALFSPDGDGENDELNITWHMDDPSGIASWKMEIKDPYGHVFKTFKGTGAPSSNIIWDGRSDSGELVSSAADYPVFLSFEDTLGNKVTALKAMTIPVDVLVERTERGLKIRINSIEFKSGESILVGMSYPILNRVAQILKKYSTYKVEIQGHTDDVGSLEMNTRLSEERAKAVLEYLVRQGVTRSRLTAVGLAYQYPVASNDTDEGRSRNRRVEFILIKE